MGWGLTAALRSVVHDLRVVGAVEQRVAVDGRGRRKRARRQERGQHRHGAANALLPSCPPPPAAPTPPSAVGWLEWLADRRGWGWSESGGAQLKHPLIGSGTSVGAAPSAPPPSLPLSCSGCVSCPQCGPRVFIDHHLSRDCKCEIQDSRRSCRLRRPVLSLLACSVKDQIYTRGLL